MITKNASGPERVKECGFGPIIPTLSHHGDTVSGVSATSRVLVSYASRNQHMNLQVNGSIGRTISGTLILTDDYYP